VKIGVISDTHIPIQAKMLPGKIFEIFQGVDRIWHAGDIEYPMVLNQLERVAPVSAVAGNMDSLMPDLPVKREFIVEECAVGIIHGYGGPRNQIRDRIRREFKKPRLIVYGHTHIPFWGEEAGIFFMNPGSPTVGRDYPSVGILEIQSGRIHGEIIAL
jgi:putative phosphoesterase